MKTLAIYNCADRTNNNLEEVFYTDGDGGTVVQSNAVPESASGYSEVVPDSIGEAILKFACKEGVRKK